MQGAPGSAHTVDMKVLLVIASVLVGIGVVAGVMSEPNGVQALRSADMYADHYNARMAAVAHLAYGPRTLCVEGECSGEVYCGGHENGKTVVWECVRGHSLDENPHRVCVIEQDGKLQITRREDDPDPCDNS